ncbi:MAG: hypothetical protein AMJ95_10005 [Omnitrophica WOR_2 bacterium SM23_72]|nr:MAG: hypothetical protein AMJ95_10005 [Omnitrophica WOR_2 bacterium SM23_72]
MKNSLKLKTVAWALVLLGFLYVYAAFLIKYSGTHIGSRYYKIFLFENLIMGICHIVFGVGLIKAQKWAVFGTIIFGASAFFLFFSRLTFFGGLRFIPLQIFYGLVVYSAVQEAKQIRSNK